MQKIHDPERERNGPLFARRSVVRILETCEAHVRRALDAQAKGVCFARGARTFPHAKQYLGC